MSAAGHVGVLDPGPINAVLAEVLPGYSARVGTHAHTGLPTVHIRPGIKRAADNETTGKLVWRAFFLCQPYVGHRVRCWDCWWADLHSDSCDHELVWS